MYIFFYSELNPETFTGLIHVSYFSLADNYLPDIPIQVLDRMPNIATLDLGRLRVRVMRDGSLNVSILYNNKNYEKRLCILH